MLKPGRRITPHFTTVISANDRMEQQVECLIKSLARYGSFHFTTFIQEREKISSKFLQDHSDIQTYKADPEFHCPWNTCPRWDAKPKSELYIGIDPDVIAMNDYKRDLASCAKYEICGTLAYKSHLNLEQWRVLFDDAGIEYPPELYPCCHNGDEMPYYLNNGLITLQSDRVEDMRLATKDMLKIANKRHYGLFFIVQVATCLAVHKLGLDRKLTSTSFHQLETFDPNPNNETIFFHYNLHKNRFSSLSEQLSLD